MSWFKNWSFSRKLIAVNLAYVLPCAVLVYFLISEKNGSLEFSRKEHIGLEYQRPLESILAHVSEYKVLLAASFHNGVDVTGRIDLVHGQIERDFSQLEEVDGKFSEDLQFTSAGLGARKREKASAQSLKSMWETLERQRSTFTVDNLSDQFKPLIDSTRLAITHLGDTSNLILDPDLDSYYLMDVTLMALPMMSDRLQEAATYLKDVSTASSLSEDQKLKLQVYATLLSDDVGRVLGSVQTALMEDRNFGGVMPSLQRDIPPAFKDFESSVRQFNAKLLTVAKAIPDTKSESLSSLADQSIEATLAFWTKAADVLDDLLTKRREDIAHARMMALIWALLAWLPSCVIAVLTVSHLNKAFINSVSKLESEAAMASMSSAHLASASQTVSSGSTEQAAAIQETGASMSEMASMVSRSSTQAVSSQELARKVREQTDEGCRVMERMVHSMDSIEDANRHLQNISNIIEDISGKTNIINDIVGKTQLLSFNASIEAARAGQHGRGFAVVAEEVGNLAQTSGNAAKEIRSLIDDSRQQVGHILKSTLEKVSEGKVVTGQAQDIFAIIAKDISTISAQIESISEAAREQQFGIEQIAKAMTQMDQSTQSNNSAAHTAARLSDQLMGQSRKLSGIAKTVSRLVVGSKVVDTREREKDPRQDFDSPSLSQTRNYDDKYMYASKNTDSEHFSSDLSHRERELDQSPNSSGVPSTIDANDDSFQKVV